MYVQVILPLKLPFEPTYEAPDGTRTGDYVRVNLAGKDYIGVVSATVTEASRKVKPVMARLPKLPSESSSTLAFWKTMAGYYLCTVGEVFKCARPTARLEDLLKDAERNAKAESDRAFKRQVRLSKLIDKSLALEMRESRKEEQMRKARKDDSRERYVRELDVIRRDIRKVRDEMDSLKARHDGSVDGSLALELKEFTGSEADRISAVLDPCRPAVWRGARMETRMATYAELANRRLQEGKSSLVLLPETYRTKMMQEALKGYIPEVLILDGKSTAAQVRETLKRIRDGRPYVLVGSRSAVLLPHRDLGLVIVDDEHDASYKQESPAPRYNARDMAVLLSAKEVPVLMSSPFPSLETMLNVKAGKYSLVDGGGVPCRCFVVDTPREARKRGMADILSRKLIQEVNEAVAAGRQAVIMVPRKAYSPLLKCPGCKELVTCPDCGGYVFVERTSEGVVMRCGQCGETVPYTGRCGKCGTELKPVGAGLGRCEEIVRQFYPSLVIESVDGDMSEKEQKGVFDRFSEGNVDVLVGTQVVQKAFGCANIGCIGVLDADRWFTGDDFRADERAVQMLCRLRDMVAPGGCLVLQTKDYSRPAFRELDTEGYYVSEDEEPGRLLVDALLDERAVVGYPPYARVVDVRVTDANAGRRGYLAGLLGDVLRMGGLSVTGPYGKPGAGEEARLHLLVFLKRDRTLGERKDDIRKIAEDFMKERKYEGFVTMDVDPV